MLVPLWALDLLRPGEELICIDGQTVTVGEDSIDTDTRGGCMDEVQSHHLALGRSNTNTVFVDMG